MLVKADKIACTNSRNDSISTMVNTIIKVPVKLVKGIELGTILLDVESTHKDNFVI